MLDAFGGSQSIAYLIKQPGKSTHTNDFLSFNHQIAKALIDNKSNEWHKRKNVDENRLKEDLDKVQYCAWGGNQNNSLDKHLVSQYVKKLSSYCELQKINQYLGSFNHSSLKEISFTFKGTVYNSLADVIFIVK